MAFEDLYQNIFNDSFGNSFGNKFGLGSGNGNFSRNNYGYGPNNLNILATEPNEGNAGNEGNAEEADNPERTYSQNFLGTDESSMFGRNLIHNTANDINADNKVQSQATYQQRINEQPASLGAAPGAPAPVPGAPAPVPGAPAPVPGAAASNATTYKGAAQNGNSFYDGRVTQNN